MRIRRRKGETGERWQVIDEAGRVVLVLHRDAGDHFFTRGDGFKISTLTTEDLPAAARLLAKAAGFRVTEV